MVRGWKAAFVFAWTGLALIAVPAVGAPKKKVSKPPSAKRASKNSAAPKDAKAAAARKKPRKTSPPAASKPPADIPAVTEEASVWQGCMEPGDLPVLSSSLGMDDSRLNTLLEGEKLTAGTGRACLPYALVTGGQGGVASAMFKRQNAEPGESPVVAVRKLSDGVTVTPGACGDCNEAERRILNIPAREIFDPSSEIIAALPANVKWQLDVLAPPMIAGTTERSAIRESQAEAAAYNVRIVLKRDSQEEAERLQSVEILDAATGERLDGVWWLERTDGPGVFIGMEGLSYERMLWQSPVKYVRKSRGVGPAITTFFRRIVKKGNNGARVATTAKRAVTVREYHLGTDMTAPKGVDVHAVGDATVSFAGRGGGFGNLVILDHGHGYQTYYAHLSRIASGMKPGTKVAAGEIVGLVGSTGRSTAPHLHFETRKDAKYIDPFDDSKQLDFWLLSADDQERLGMQLLESSPADGGDPGIASTPKPSAQPASD